MKNVKRYLVIWYLMSKNTFLVNTHKKSGFFIFFLGKILRVLLSVFFIFYVMQGAKTLAGYTTNQVIFFFLTFTLIDALAQLFFRNVYTFRQMVVTGSFDLILSKPVNALFRILLGGMDIIDLATIPLYLGVLIWWGMKLGPSLYGYMVFCFLVINSLIIAAAFHTFVVSFGIITFEVDHLIMIYRDVENMGRFPIDIYREPLKSILTFVIPLGIMLTVPAKAFMGLVSFTSIAVSVLISSFLFYASLRFWNFSLKKYSSASS
jgi:ABC-2 type transport system permease protein